MSDKPTRAYPVVSAGRNIWDRPLRTDPSRWGVLKQPDKQKPTTHEFANNQPEVGGELPQPRVLGFGLLEDGDVGVGIFPEREEVFVSGERPDAGSVCAL